MSRYLRTACSAALLLANSALAQSSGDPKSPAMEIKPAVIPPMPAEVKADRAESLPHELEGVGITEQLGKQVPLELTFTDSEGRAVRLRDYFDGRRPVVLNLGYFGCPMLCGLVLDGLIEAMQEIPLSVGEDFTVLTLSIDASEKAVIAQLGKQNAVRKLGQSEAAKAWHFLSGSEENIRKLTDAVGFGFKWNERRKEYAHAAALIILTPEGTVSRYLYGVQFPAKTVRLSLVEASQGKIGTTLDQLLLYCFHYDAAERVYALAAMNLMRLAGGVTVLALGSGIGLALIRERRRRRVLEPTVEA